MKNWIDIGVKALLAIGLVVLFALYVDNKNELVYVDAQRLMLGYKGTQTARKEFEVKVATWKANIDTLRGEVDAKMNEYESKKLRMSAGEKKLMEELIRTKQDQYLNYQQVIQEKIQQEDQEMSKKVLDKVNDYVKKYGKEKGYKIILAATQYGNIIYAEEGIDVTDDIMKGLNSEFK